MVYHSLCWIFGVSLAVLSPQLKLSIVLHLHSTPRCRSVHYHRDAHGTNTIRRWA